MSNELIDRSRALGGGGSKQHVILASLILVIAACGKSNSKECTEARGAAVADIKAYTADVENRSSGAKVDEKRRTGGVSRRAQQLDDIAATTNAVTRDLGAANAPKGACSAALTKLQSLPADLEGTALREQAISKLQAAVKACE